MKEIRTDVEAPREMNGQTVYFDEDHHPIMDSIDERQETEQPSLFTPEEYSLWTQEVTRVNKEIKEAPTTASRKQSRKGEQGNTLDCHSGA